MIRPPASLRGAFLRRTGTVLLTASLALTVAGCTSPGTPSPPSGGAGVSATPKIDPGALIGGVIDPVATVWSGTDSAGETTVFALNADNAVDVTFGSSSYSDPNDSWRVSDGVLDVDVYIDEARGVARYTATWDPAMSILSASATTTVSGQSLTVDLTEK